MFFRSSQIELEKNKDKIKYLVFSEVYKRSFFSVFLKTISELKRTVKIHQMTNKRVIRKWYSVIQSALLPILESWSGQKLSKDAIIYGVRRYYR